MAALGGLLESPAYNEVLDISCSLVNASEAGDVRAKWSAYQKLEQLCEQYAPTEHNHPMQWEALADFTTDDFASISIYEKALSLASKMKLPEYEASICLAMAERHVDLGETVSAKELAWRAHSFAINTNNLELRQEISEFLASQNAAT